MSFNKGRAAREAWQARQREAQEQESQMATTVDERLIAILEQQANNQATQNDRLAPRENPKYVAVSPTLQPNGEPWSRKLKCEMFLGSFPMHDTPLTQAEVEALNRLEPATGLSVMKNDRTHVKVEILGKRDAVGRLERLTIKMPLRDEDGARIGYSGIVEIATELAGQMPKPEATIEAVTA